MKRHVYIKSLKVMYGLFFLTLFLLFFYTCNSKEINSPSPVINAEDTSDPKSIFDSVSYRKRLKQLANADKTGRWPPATVLPLQNAIIPFYRIVAFYGNFFNPQMGILGEFPAPVMLQKLKEQVSLWEQADTLTPVLPALHYIAVTAQSSSGDGYYRLRMSDNEIRKVIDLADSIKGIVFLDIQVGLSDLKNELPRLERFLKLPHVHLGIDPEYAMKTGKKPGSAMGTLDADDINYASAWLASLVNKYQLPPKILVVHRFTGAMLTNYQSILTRPEVQIVINMDGFGTPSLKKNTYYHFIYKQPVQFAGFKVFYKNDVKAGGRIMQPSEILQLKPKPVYIQYQ